MQEQNFCSFLFTNKIGIHLYPSPFFKPSNETLSCIQGLNDCEPLKHNSRKTTFPMCSARTRIILFLYKHIFFINQHNDINRMNELIEDQGEDK